MGIVTSNRRRVFADGQDSCTLCATTCRGDGVPVTSAGNGRSQPGCVCRLFLAVDFKCSFLAVVGPAPAAVAVCSVFASRSVCNQVPTCNPQLLISSPVPPVWPPPGRNFVRIDSYPSASSHVCNCHHHRFYMYDNFPFICQVNICKSYTHTNEIIIMITNIFFPCFIA